VGESDADAMRAALMAHDDVLRTAIEAHQGFLFQSHRRWCGRRVRLAEAAVDAAIARSART